MQVVHSNTFNKRNETLTTIARNASCSRGWLRVVVQSTFGTIIVSSFILILLMAVRSSPLHKNHCQVSGCRVFCSEALYNERFEDDIMFATSDAETNCRRIFLILRRPSFINGSLPVNWLAGIRSNVRELAIIGGNLRHIPPGAFMTQFAGNIRNILLKAVTLTVLSPDTFIGLSNLNVLTISNCPLHLIQTNALEAIDDTLLQLHIYSTSIWNPVNITGSVNFRTLTLVDFSSNYFGSMLDRNSFKMLKVCRVLYLNSCKITSLGTGTFDYLQNIEILYLNDNYLSTIPVGLFDKILPRQPRIALQDNLWKCDCSQQDLVAIARKNIFIVEPTCCYPYSVRGMLFSDFLYYCNKKKDTDVTITDSFKINQIYTSNNKSSFIYMDKKCSALNSTLTYFERKKKEPQEFSCVSNRVANHEVISNEIKDKTIPTTSDWLKPVYFMESVTYSMVEMSSKTSSRHGLIWYQSQCPTEMYCLNKLPSVLRVFNVDRNAQYTFCRIALKSRTIDNYKCVAINITDFQKNQFDYTIIHPIILYVTIASTCLVVGALCVYGIIHRYPFLLKWNKRVLLVKHKKVDALILPPKIPLRTDVTNDLFVPHCVDKSVFIVPTRVNNIECEYFGRSLSVRSTGSNDPSYISALQPTDEQLAEWRLKQLDSKSISRMESISSHTHHDYLPYYSLSSSEDSEIIKL